MPQSVFPCTLTAAPASVFQVCQDSGTSIASCAPHQIEIGGAVVVVVDELEEVVVVELELVVVVLDELVVVVLEVELLLVLVVVVDVLHVPAVSTCGWIFPVAKDISVSAGPYTALK